MSEGSPSEKEVKRVRVKSDWSHFDGWSGVVTFENEVYALVVFDDDPRPLRFDWTVLERL